MEKEKIDVLGILKKKLEDELEYKKKCDNGEISYYDSEYEVYRLSEYSQDSSRWAGLFQKLNGASSKEIIEGMQAFMQEYGKEYEQYIPSKFISKIQSLGRRTHFEETVMRDDVIEYFSRKSKEELEEEFGPEVARMKDFDQKNPHHCYDLLGHTLHTVDGIKRDGLTLEQYKELRISAFLHDIGKPVVAKMHPKIEGQQVFYGHAEKSAEIAREMLSKLGYTEEQVKRMEFYIGHHDDFISYKTNDQITPQVADHEYIRGITPETVAEIMFQNEYESTFKYNGYSKDQIRYICYALARGQEPKFINNGRPVEINSSMQQAEEVVQSHSNAKNYWIRSESAYQKEYPVIDFYDRYSLEDYQMLMHLCRADANAQSERVEIGGKEVASKAGKLANMNAIDTSLPDAKRIFDLVKLSNLFLGNIIKASPTQEIKDEKLSELSDEGLYYLEEYGYTPWYEHTDVLRWINLADKPSAFLIELRTRIEQQKTTMSRDDVDMEAFNGYYEGDIQDLDRMIKIRTRKERVQPLEAQLKKEETEHKTINEAEQLLMQVNDEKRKEEGR